MKKGKWNYTEDIEYTVIVGRLHQGNKPMHWQNAFAGEHRQIVKILYEWQGVSKVFYIDNQDGSGLRKISRDGGPDSYHAEISGFDFIGELPESEWIQYDKEEHLRLRDISDKWQKENHPEEYEKLLALKQSWAESPFKKMCDEGRSVLKGSTECADIYKPNNNKVGRNDGCPCGSGKKFKHCCINKN